MKQTWLYLQNPFFNCTKKNFKKAVKISAYTDAQLLTKSSDTLFALLSEDYHLAAFIVVGGMYLTPITNFNYPQGKRI